MKELILMIAGLLLAATLVFASVSHAATLTWTEVPDTAEYTIGGHMVYFWTEANKDDPDVMKVPKCPENINEPCEDLLIRDIENTLNLVPGKTYTITVAPYTTFNVLGEESTPIEFFCGSRTLPEDSLPTQLYFPGPVTINIEQE